MAADDLRCAELAVELANGPDRGSTVLIENSQGGGAPTIGPGDRVVVGFTPDAPPLGVVLLAGLIGVAVGGAGPDAGTAGPWPAPPSASGCC
ncbi:MAG: hypothetical protein ACRD1K_00250 [Acidimicrobiales bacterium]